MDLAATPHLLPRSGPPTLLYIYLHGVGATPLQMAPVAERFAAAWPHAAHLLPEGFAPFDLDGEGRQWFPVSGVTDGNRPARVDAALPALVAFVRVAQRHFGIEPAATALVGFSQGAILALEAAQREPGLVGRVVAIGGRYATLPTAAPPTTVIHLVHGRDDQVLAARHAVEAAHHLVALGADVTADVVPGIGHAPHPELVARAIEHLQTFLPRRTWAAALADAPVQATKASSRDLDPAG